MGPQYTHLLEMHDPGEKENENSLLVAPLGKGTFIYSTLTFFEQLPGGVPGSARLLVNLLSAGCQPEIDRSLLSLESTASSVCHSEDSESGR